MTAETEAEIIEKAASSVDCVKLIQSKGQATTSREHGVKQTRGRYVGLACDECKRRKIKCTGTSPCHRCKKTRHQCIFTQNFCRRNIRYDRQFKLLCPTNAFPELPAVVEPINAAIPWIFFEDQISRDHYETAHNRVLQSTDRQMLRLNGHILRKPLMEHGKSPQHCFYGLSSSDFVLSLIRSDLQDLGLIAAEKVIEDREIPLYEGITQVAVFETTNLVTPVAVGERNHAVTLPEDPIWLFSREQASKICQSFTKQTQEIYPILDMGKMMQCIGSIFQPNIVGVNLQDQDSDLLKLVLAIMMTIKGRGKSEIGQRLFDNVSSRVSVRYSENLNNVADIQRFTLMALYHYHSDEERLAWRIMGIAARSCLELGLHRNDTYLSMFSSNIERETALKLFWSVFVFDHCWSLGIGLSPAFGDSEVDKRLSKPIGAPFISHMIELCSISADCNKCIAAMEFSYLKAYVDSVRHVNFRIEQWYSSIPPPLRLLDPIIQGVAERSRSKSNRTAETAIFNQSVLLYLYSNQIRIIVFRIILQSSDWVESSPLELNFAETAVEISKDTIHILAQIAAQKEIDRILQVPLNYFLLSALATLSLAVFRRPADFTESTRDEMRTAFELVRPLTEDSYVGERLWNTIHMMQNIQFCFNSALAYT